MQVAALLCTCCPRSRREDKPAVSTKSCSSRGQLKGRSTFPVLMFCWIMACRHYFHHLCRGCKWRQYFCFAIYIGVFSFWTSRLARCLFFLSLCFYTCFKKGREPNLLPSHVHCFTCLFFPSILISFGGRRFLYHVFWLS